VIELAPRVLMRVVPAVLAEKLERRHRDAGVDIRLAEMLIARCAVPSPADLADPDVRLKSPLK